MQDQLLSNPELPVLKFATPVIVVGRGNVNKLQLQEFVALGYPVIGADGAADELITSGIEVTAIVGDLDSIADKSTYGAQTVLIEIDEQETIDFEKCLCAIDAPLFICFGMLGKRVDQTLAAFHTIGRQALQKHIILVDDIDVVYGAVGDFTIDLPLNIRFSIYPLKPIKFERSTGLAFPLDNLKLEVAKRIGTSNCVSDDVVKLKTANGYNNPYLIILPKAHLPVLVDLVFDQ